MSFVKNFGKTIDMTKGNEAKSIIRFAIPLSLGNLFQQVYNLTDTLIVGRFAGPNALAAVGSTYSLMIFITSLIIGLCIGSSVVFSKFYGSKEYDSLQKSFVLSFVLIGAFTLILNIICFFNIDNILNLV